MRQNRDLTSCERIRHRFAPSRDLIPEAVTEIRVVDIVGLDRQADGGTNVASTGEVGRVRVVKTESKGKGNKRIRLEVVDVPDGACDLPTARLIRAAEV